MLIGKEKLKEIAITAGVDQIGVTTAEPLYYMHKKLQLRADEGRISPFEEPDPDSRITPQHLLTGCRSIITLAVPYAAPDHLLPETEIGPKGMVARCAQGIDYHHIVENKATRIAEAIRVEAASSFSYRILTDRSPLLERELAANSGLGWIGENCTLINPIYGSYTALGTILVDRDIEPDEAVSPSCLGCGQCRSACPTGAIAKPFTMDPYRCLSYLTQAAGVIPREMRLAFGNHIYGCDRCQDACPHNQDPVSSPISELAFPFFPASPLLIPLLELTRREYELTIGLTSAGWRGKTTLQRNVVIALGNIGDKTAVKPLSRLLENDPRSLIRLHAAWSLGKIGGSKAVFALEKSLKYDRDNEVREETILALEACS